MLVPKINPIAASTTYDELLAQTEVIRLFGVHIRGIEVTQAIQYYRAQDHLIDVQDRGRDNGVTLVAGKPAWVRVYVRSGLLVAQVPGVTGKLEILRRSNGLYYNPVATLSPRTPRVVTARQNPSYTSERVNRNFTLNFVIPARTRAALPGISSRESIEVMCGYLRLRVTITAPNGQSDTQELDLDVTLEQTLRVRGIMVSYNGPASSAPTAPNLVLAAPTLANLQTTAALALLMFPVQSAGIFSRGGTILFNQHLQDTVTTAGRCSPNWQTLLAQLQAQRTADGNRSDWIYYGLLPANMPVGTTTNTNSGCGDQGLGASPAGFGLTMAHELAHACEVRHAPCGNVGTSSQVVEWDYPAFEPYDPAGTPQASIGEYGLNVSNGNIFSPNNTKDLMSYCGAPTWRNWISLYTYGLLLNNTHLAPRGVCRDESYWDEAMYDPWWRLPWRWLPDPSPEEWRRSLEPLISIIGIVQAEHQVEVRSVMRVEANSAVQNAHATDLSVELVGAAGDARARASLYALNTHGHGGSCRDCNEGLQRYPFVFQALVPDVEPGVALVIRQGERELWTRRAPESAPEVMAFRAQVQPDQITLSWEIRSAVDEAQEIWIQWSKDGGQIWNALATGVYSHETALDLANLPSGRVQLRLLASDGFHTAVSGPVDLEIPGRAPEVSVLTPRDGQTLVAGDTQRIWGAALRSNGESVPDDNARWLLDGEEVALGFDDFLDVPAAGEHHLSLIVEADDTHAEASVNFRVIEVQREGQEAESL